MQVRWGILGCGNIARTAVAPAIRWSSNGVIAAVASRSAETAQRLGEQLGAVRAPTLVLRGAESPLLTRAGAHELMRGLPDARLVEIAGAGHHLQLERPAECLAEILPFLERHCPV